MLCEAGLVDHVFEANQFMVDENGDFQYDPSLLKRCHNECERLTREALQCGKNVAVTNTMIKRWEVTKYIEMSDDVTVITLEGKFPNTRGTPDSIVRKQRNQMERW